MADYYEVLGIERNSDSTQIRTAYKRLAMQYHPDRNPGNPSAEEAFKQINEAYHILSDPLKKSRYDARLYAYTDAAMYTDAYWQTLQQKRYQQWKQQQTSYQFDRNYFKIQGLAFLVFIIISGFCFGIIRATYYFIAKHETELWNENSVLLKRVNQLFESGQFEEAFTMINSLHEKDPAEYRFNFTRDSLVTELRNLADAEFKTDDFLAAVKHYNLLKGYEGGNRMETLNKIAYCEYALGHYTQSLLAMKHLHNQQPWNLGLIYEIGMINYEKLNNKTEALQYFTLGKKQFKQNLSEVYGKAFEILMDPKDAPDVYFQIFEARARVNIDLKNYKEAITDCNWAIFLRPHQGKPYYLRAIAKLNHKEYWYICDDLAKARELGVQLTAEMERKHCR